jgi:hypothetical protein
MMKNFIEVLDNAISPYFADVIEKNILHQGNKGKVNFKFFNDFVSYHPIHSPGKNQKGFGFGHTYLQFPSPIEDPSMLFFNQILYKGAFSLNFIISQILQVRIWITVPETKNFITFAHVDRYDPHFSLLYYVNDSDGDTVFFEDDKTTIIKKVSPKKGRMVLFDGSIPHAASTPTKNSRCIINYNFSILN